MAAPEVPIDELIATANAIRRERYADAEVVFLAGSLTRGEGTSMSDLDLVVVFKEIPNAYRESFRFGRWPVEAFVHDPKTLNYFFLQIDRVEGIPSLPAMVSEGLEVPGPSEFSRDLKRFADTVLERGPPIWGRIDIDNSRYAITDLIDDLRQPRSRAEQTATATMLYGALANHYLRKRGLWSAKGKTVPRRLRAVDSSFADQFETSFEALFRDGDSAELIRLAEEILAPDGGWLFEGYVLHAPRKWKSARIRPETEADRAAVRAVNRAAFPTPAEANLVEALNAKGAPLTSLVAEVDGNVVGHILFTPVSLTDNAHLKIAGLGPMAVLPDHQRKGLGSALVREGVSRCKDLGYCAVVVLGHPEYYPRFGFVPGDRYGLRCEYDVPADVFMVVELEPGALDGASGLVRYDELFSSS